ncbi:MAG: T9SS type A sorting domain-containing protein [Ignavibacteria bacterium]|jgi:hypothetical protein
MRKSVLVHLVLICVFALSLQAQTPQYYNINDGYVSNSFPFNRPLGKAVNTLFMPGDFNQPTALPAGKKITKIYFRISVGGTRTFTDLRILLAQDTLTLLTRGSFYTGPYDTVYYQASTNLTATANGWMSVTLNHPYIYDITKSLIMFVEQCGSTGSGISVYNTDLPIDGVRRVWSIGGCPFVPSATSDSSVVNLGLDVESALSVNTQTEIVNEYSLSQNYPNPFNPVTEISYALPKSGLVTLKVYDLLGKEVATLVNEVKNAGSYSINFDGASVSSGMYYYKLDVNGFVSTKKMMLIK